MTLDGPNQLWVADITYVAITTSFVYLAVTLDAWSRRVVGYAISRSIDARLAAAALKAAISARNPPAGLRASFRPWVAIRFRNLSRCLSFRNLSRCLTRARIRRFDEPPRQSIR